MHFLMRLKNKTPKIEIYDDTTLEEDKKFFKVKNALDLNKHSYDHRVFNSLEKAEKFKADFEKTWNNLDNSKICKSRNLPVILIKRRYLVLALLGIKMQTCRNSPRVIKMLAGLKKGEAFNLTDQTFTLTVLLDKKIEKKDGAIEYRYNLPQ